MKSIFVIDDDPVLQKIMSRMINNLDASIHVYPFVDGNEAIEGLTRSDSLPDLIFLDVNMPQMNAWQFMQSFNKLKIKEIPIYILSSSIDKRDINRANSIDLVKRYLIKPITKQELQDICNEESILM